MSATWTAERHDPASPATCVSVYFSDGFVQTVQLGATATSWSTTIDDVLRHRVLRCSYTVTTQTNYGWTKESAHTGDLPVLTA